MGKFRTWSLYAGLVACACGTAWGQGYPSRPVRVVIVFAPGGGNDIVGRIAFQKVSDQLNQQFIIDNRPGAGGTVGASFVAKSPADGYTLMVFSTTLVANAHLYKKLPYDALKDFVGITPVARLTGMLVVHPSMPVRTVKDLIALGKARPGEISYGTAGVGSYQHLSVSLFASMAGIKLVHIPYKGAGPAAIATAGGDVQTMLTGISGLLPHIKAGRVRPIGVSSDTRSRQFPDVPAIAETVQGYEFTSWIGAFAPAGTPKAVVDRLNAELRKAVADPGVISNLSSQSLDPMYLTPEAFAKVLRADYETYERVVRISGAQPE